MAVSPETLTRDINGHLIRVYREMTKDFESVVLNGSGTMKPARDSSTI